MGSSVSTTQDNDSLLSTPQDNSIFRYYVTIPAFVHGSTSPSENEEMIKIYICSDTLPMLDRSEHVHFPQGIQTLARCKAVVEYGDRELDLKQLVGELLYLGCGQVTARIQTPSTLSHGERLTRITQYHYDLDERLTRLTGGIAHSSGGSLHGHSPSTISSSTSPASFMSRSRNQSPLSSVTSSATALSGNRFHSLPSPFEPIGDNPFVPFPSSNPAMYDSPINLAAYVPPTIHPFFASQTSSAIHSPISQFTTPASFMSGNSPASFMTARSTYTSPAFSSVYGLSPVARIDTIREDETCDPSMSIAHQKLRNDYYTHLHQQDIVQPFDKELNWSGKGQHVTFPLKDSIPLIVLTHLGSSMTAKVDKVLCKRVALARKTMRCSRDWSVADALREVYHLQNLRHHHIIQLVGSYLQGRQFSILLYPVAHWHLGAFLEDTADMNTGTSTHDLERRLVSLAQAFLCLTSALAYVHEHTTKHMDIKPQNVLVREVGCGEYRTYLADFGLSRSFASQEHSQTDGPISRTPRYCAPEVYRDEPRGRSADIFSLGCVFSEILTVLHGRHPHDFADHKKGEGHDESFHANLGRVQGWLDDFFLSKPEQWSGREFLPVLVHIRTRRVVQRMLSEEPGARPTASNIQAELLSHGAFVFAPNTCCRLPPEQYVAYEDTSPDES